MLGAEEAWVDDPRDAWWLQDAVRSHLHTQSFLTAGARSPPPALDARSTRATRRSPPRSSAFLGALASAQTLTRAAARRARRDRSRARPRARRRPRRSRGSRRRSKLSPTAKPLALEAGKDLTALLPAICPTTRSPPTGATCASEMATRPRDRRAGRARASSRAIRDAARSHAARARIVEVGSTGEPAGDRRRRRRARSAARARRRRAPLAPRTVRTIAARLHDHDRGSDDAVFVGLSRPRPRAACSSTSRRRPRYDRHGRRRGPRLPHLEPLHRPRRALAVHEDVGRGARVLERRCTRSSTQGAARVLRRALPAAAADAALRDRRARARRSPIRTSRATRSPRRSTRASPNGYEARARGDGRRPRRRRHARRRARVPHAGARAGRPRRSRASSCSTRMPAVYGKVLPGYGKPASDGASTS